MRAGVSSYYTENQKCGSHVTDNQAYAGAVIEFFCDPPVLAKYVSVDIDPSSSVDANPVLQIAEVMVEEYTSEECAANSCKNVVFLVAYKCSYLWTLNVKVVCVCVTPTLPSQASLHLKPKYIFSKMSQNLWIHIIMIFDQWYLIVNGISKL